MPPRRAGRSDEGSVSRRAEAPPPRGPERFRDGVSAGTGHPGAERSPHTPHAHVLVSRMAKRGAVPQHANRKNVTLRIDRDVYAQAWRVVELMPGVSMSDVVEDFLREFGEGLLPVMLQMQGVEDRDEALGLVQEMFAGMLGQAALAFVRDNAAIVGRGDGSSDG